MARLRDQVVLITGCSSGIGRALVGALVRDGHHVIATARRVESIEGLRALGPVTTLALDVDDPASVEAAVREAIARVGRIDVVVNNAGFNVVGPLAEVPIADVRALFATNVLGPLALVQAVVPHMAARGGGRIVNVGSMVGVLGTPFTGAYCASKAAVHMLTDVLRLELAPFGIDVVSLEPGRVRSEISNNARVELARYDEPRSLYEPFARGIRRRLGASQVRPTDTGVFAARVARAIMRERAPRVVRSGRGSLLLPLLRRFVPPPLLDWGLRRVFSLGRRRSG